MQVIPGMRPDNVCLTVALDAIIQAHTNIRCHDVLIAGDPQIVDYASTADVLPFFIILSWLDPLLCCCCAPATHIHCDYCHANRCESTAR